MSGPGPVGGATHLECSATGEAHESEQLQRLSRAGKPLLARYDLEALRGRFTREAVRGRGADLWRYAEVLPVRTPEARVSLGEGWTPLLSAPRLAAVLGLERLWIKDEGLNPTGSFKARGMAMAVSRALELGAGEVALPSAGNAGAAAAAYAAAAGLVAHVVVPSDAPPAIVEAIRVLGADLRLLDGLISDCRRMVAEEAARHGWFDLSTLEEPYRVEGKKTMAYELVEQLGGRVPDVIVFPTGGGTGMIGMWKAFDEMERLGWIGAERPRMVCVQAAGCAPLVRAWEAGAERAEPWQGARTQAPGLRVPAAVGDFLVLRSIRESRGAAVAVEDAEMRAWARRIGAETGVLASLEGAATAAAVRILLARAWVSPEDELVLFNTGTGLAYVGEDPSVRE
ncbi:MAG TPA: threonine synthase [Longimicrobiales bacterium]|nr:threonine synthase [Longimicrobiales bacterium]